MKEYFYMNDFEFIYKIEIYGVFYMLKVHKPAAIANSVKLFNYSLFREN